MDIAGILKRFDAARRRAVFFYAARYIKQAKNTPNYKKDIFDDGAQNTPSEEIRNATLEIIKAIEEREGNEARYFDDITMIRILTEITSLESGLTPELSESERERARRLVAKMVPPPISRT